jgi:hypothetical protein
MTGIMQVIVGASYLSSPVNTVAPAVTGTAQARQTLSSTTGTWKGSPTTFSYQWKRGATNVGTNSSSYTLVTDDVGSTMTCVVTASNGVGSNTATSNATSSVAANTPLAPTIGTATATGTSTATVSYTAPSDNGGSTITSYTATSSPGGITGTLSQAGSGTITVSGLSGGTAYTFTVAATNSAGAGSASSASNSVTTQMSIGQAFGGGFYAGQISTTGDGVATHYLVVAPKATGQNSSRSWGVYGTTTGTTSAIDGPTNSATLAALGAAYEAANFCENLTIGAYSDWYLPAWNELEVLYYFLKPTTDNNDTAGNGSNGNGKNANAVSPEPISTNYTSGSPAQTSAGIGFRTGESEAFPSYNHWSSTENNFANARLQTFLNGNQYNFSGYKPNSYHVRAIRRVPI